MYNRGMSKTSTKAVRQAATEITGHCLGVRTRMADRAISGIFDRALRPLGLRITQLTMLAAVGQEGVAGPSQLGSWLYLEKSTVSRNIDRMIAQGWLDPIPSDDGRSYRVRLSPDGAQILTAAMATWREAQAECESLLGPELAHELDDLAGRLGLPG